MRLLKAYAESLWEWSQVINDQIIAILAEDPDFGRFDALIHLAGQQKDRAKYTYLAHVAGAWLRRGLIV